MHNDLHKGNVLLHFPTHTDSVYAGIADWSRCTKEGTEWKSFRPDDTSPASLQQYRQRFLYIAPECFATKESKKIYLASKKQDIYSICFMVRDLLMLYLRNPHSIPYQRYIDYVMEYVKKGLSIIPRNVWNPMYFWKHYMLRYPWV